MNFIAKLLLRTLPKGIFAILRIVTDMREAQKGGLSAHTLYCWSAREPCVEDYGEFPAKASWARSKVAFRERSVCMFDEAVLFVRTGDIMVGGKMVAGCGSGIKGTVMTTPWARLLKVLKTVFGGIRRLPVKENGYVFVKSNGYYHFLMESLVQTLLALKSHPDAEVLVAKREYMGFVREYVELLKERGVIKHVNMVEGEVVRVPRYVVCDLESDSSCVCGLSVSLLRSAFCETSGCGERKVFVTRRGRRMFDNQEEIENTMAALGFEVVDTAPMNIEDEIEFFSGVSFVVANHGAGLTNIIYAPTGAKVIELFSPKWLHDVYFRLAKACGHTYGLCVAKQKDGESGWGRIDCAELRRMVSGME